MPRPPFTIAEILAWADAHHARTGKWPTIHSGPVYEALDESWLNINNAMCAGMRGFTRRQTTLARLLAEHRGKRNPGALPPITAEQILTWADEHRQRTGKWPTFLAGPIPGTEETWQTVQMALFRGKRGLAKNSLAKLIAAVRTEAPSRLPSPEQTLRWADEHHERTRAWPTCKSGVIVGSDNWRWDSLDRALRYAKRLSVHQLLVRERGIVPLRNKPKLTHKQILAWADAHRERTGRWPAMSSGNVVGAPHESWSQIDISLKKGKRGLEPGSSLVRLLAKERGRSLHERVPPLTLEQIRERARDYKKRHCQWPDRQSGDVEGMPGETWLAIFMALYQGSRGLTRRTKVSKVFVD